MSNAKRQTKHLYLLPVLSIVPMVAVLLAMSRLNLYFDSIVYAGVAVAYVAINVIYRNLHGTLKPYYVVEYSLVALLAYFVLSQYA